MRALRVCSISSLETRYHSRQAGNGGDEPRPASESGATPSGVLRPGDFVLTQGDKLTSELIRFGQGLRFRGPDSKYTYWNHAALDTLVVGDDGTIVEALGTGVQCRNIAVYRDTQRTLMHIAASREDRQQACAFAECSVGEPYGFLT